jgi:uncharacterized protein YndB with AHSA1/START domain
MQTEYGSIERELHIEATPEIVYEVISTPAHLQEWWPDEAELKPVPGGAGVFTFGDSSTPDAKVAQLTVVDADPPRRFSFRWGHDEGVTAAPGNSFLVCFDLVPSGAGTLLRMTESGFREMGWEAAVLEETYLDHVNGWDYFLPRLVTYAARIVSAS